MNKLESTTDNVIIRGLEVTDWEDIAVIFLSLKRQWLRQYFPYQSPSQIKQKTQELVEKGHSLVAVIGDKVVGTIGLETNLGRRFHVGNIGLVVHNDYQGQGIGSNLLATMIDFAEENLNLTRLELIVYCDNKIAIDLYRKHGFVIEGKQKKYACYDGIFIDAYMMARLK